MKLATQSRNSRLRTGGYMLSFLLLLLSTSNIYGQTTTTAPPGIPFQAFVRDLSGNIAQKREVIIIATILDGSPSGPVVLKEQFKATTDAEGVFSIILGQGILLGGSPGEISKIDWAKGVYYLNIQTAVPTTTAMPSNWDYTQSLKDMGTTQIWSAPYALNAGSVSAAAVANKLNLADTLAMLNPYLRKLDTASLSNRIDVRVKYADTLAMLNPYLRKLDTANLNSRINANKQANIDTAKNIRRSLKDTAIAVRSALVDTANNLRSGINQNNQALKDTATNLRIDLATKPALKDTAIAVRSALVDTANNLRSGINQNNQALKDTATNLRIDLATKPALKDTAIAVRSALVDTANNLRSGINQNNQALKDTAIAVRSALVDTANNLRSGLSIKWSLAGNAGTTTANFIGTTDAQPLTLKTNNTNALSITADQKIGIGTTSPNTKLEINSGYPDSAGLRFTTLTAASKYTDSTTQKLLSVDSAGNIILAKLAADSSQLQKITQNGSTGWRVLGRNPANYGNIGSGAIDLSYSNGTYTTTGGATGDDAVAMGQSTTAKGSAATAMGYRTTATGDDAVAMGEYTTATGDGAVAMGQSTTAASDGAVAMGQSTTAKGSNAVAMGNGTTASGKNATTMGEGTIAKGFGELSIGNYNDTLEMASQMGYDAAADSSRLFTVGNGTGGVLKTAFVIQQDGKVGINTRRPNTKLEINSGYPDSTGLRFTTLTAASKYSDSTTQKLLSVDSAGNVILAKLSADSSQLQKITENGNIGWRILGRDSLNYGGIGEGAIDLSYNANTGNDTAGARGNYAVAMGQNTTASGGSSTTMGQSTTASGFASTAMGYGNKAQGTMATAMGQGTTASGVASIVMGNATTASGDYSTAMGNATTASGSTSTAMGQSTTTSGFASTAMGQRTTASGGVSTAMGNATTASGENATAMGEGATAKGFGELSIGHYNDTLEMASQMGYDAAADSSRLFTVGNGTATNALKTAFVIQQNGNVGINTRRPNTKLEINSGYPDSAGLRFTTLTAASKYTDSTTQKLLSVDSAGNVILAKLSVGDSSQLQKITKNGKIGYRILGRDTANYGDIGDGSIDLSYSNTPSTTMGATGSYSTAMGVLSTASEIYSTAMGAYTTASGMGATAMGGYSTASGIAATAMGYQTKAEGATATAMGFGTTAKSIGELSIGNNNDTLFAADPMSIALDSNRLFTVGNGTNPNNLHTAFVIQQNGFVGINTRIAETTLHLVGGFKYVDGNQAAGKVLTSDADGVANWQTADNSQLQKITENGNTGYRIFGRDAANYGNIGNQAVDLSYNTNTGNDTAGATGIFTMALGQNTSASGTAAIAMGVSSNASGETATAMGYNTTAEGSYSTATGYETIAKGWYSTAMGNKTRSEGSNSTAMGYNTTASGSTATAIGVGTTATSFAEAVVGTYNTDYNPTGTTTFNTADRAFVVGIGADANNKKDGLIVWKDGAVGIGLSTQPTEKLEVAGSVKIADGTQGNGKVLTSDANGKASWQTPASGGTTLPDQTNNSGKVLTTNGSATSWQTPTTLPNQSGNTGKVLTTDGSATSWQTPTTLPNQSGNTGKVLTTDGSATSWQTPTTLPDQTNNSGKVLITNGSTTSWGNPVSSTTSMNAFYGHSTGNLNFPLLIFAPFSASSASNNFGFSSVFMMPTTVDFTIDFYSYDDNSLIYELYEVIPDKTTSSPSLGAGPLKSCNTGAWSGTGAPPTCSISYTADGGKLYTFRLRTTDTNITNVVALFFTAFHIN